jgi:outer membrane protein assembly factor BamD
MKNWVYTHKQMLMTVGLLACVSFALPGCSYFKGGSSTPEQEAPSDAESLYGRAEAAMKAGEYLEATRLFEEVERQHPYSPLATKSEIMAAKSSYEDERYDDAILALDRFVELHPGNSEVDYALYLRALSYYEQISDVARDQAMTQNAMDSFDTLIKRFPESNYARDARLKYDLTRDHLAGKEMEIGRYYLNRGEINAAINRFGVVIQDYQTTTHTPEALHRLVESYLTLGLNDQAVRIAAVLGHNYPGSKWYQSSYKLLDPNLRSRILEDRSWFDRTVESVFKPD